MNREHERPTPEAMLARLASEQPTAAARGRLKVYLGYAAGVGKTYRMLQEARRLAAEGADVVVGYLEAHGRPETEALLDGLEQLPVLALTHHGSHLRELDLEAVLLRRPEVVLVDELPHTNPPGLRHAKRWQDVQDLLDAGISVHTTCNVQHVESLNDVVAQISGVVVRETVPDELFGETVELALVDLPPDDLLARLREGKVYVPERAEQALRHFFQRGNLVALRELALRLAADQVHAAVELARRGQTTASVWPTREQLVVCVGPSPSSGQVIRAARRLADSLGAAWTALYVDSGPLPDAARAGLVRNLQLAERLGATTASEPGDEFVGAVLAYARRHNATKVVVGSSPPARWGRSGLTERLLAQAGDLDIVVVHGAAADLPTGARAADQPSWRAWLLTALALAAATGLGLACFHLGLAEANLVMLYLAAVVWVAVQGGRQPAVVASVLAVLLFDVLFIEPRFSVAVSDTQYLFMFSVMLAVGLLIAELTARAKAQAARAERGQRRAELLYRLAQRLTTAGDPLAVMSAAEDELGAVCGGRVAVFRRKPQGLRPVVDHPAEFPADPAEVAVAQWVLDHDRPAGRGTDTLPAAEAVYLPLAAGGATHGVLGIAHHDPQYPWLPEPRSLLEACATQIALALERVELAAAAEAARLAAGTEALRSNLLASVSHDLRTPLATIAGASSTLLQTPPPPAAEQRLLIESINDEAERLSRLVTNLLRLTQLEAGLALRREWHLLEDLIGSALRATERHLAGRSITVAVSPDMLLVEVDAVLLELLLVNLLDNCARYTPPGSSLELAGCRRAGELRLTVTDCGPGVPDEDRERIFETFARGAQARAESRGSGLGLAICRAVAVAHGGSLSVSNRPAGGACFELLLPQPALPPDVPPEDDDV
ncbi:MAG: sensor histidine kinase KdpD [Fimbriimonadaceae bacterium]|nr:sensor histidine kinase KdpD [Fimbriimonadaceae bacterium]